MTDLKPRGSVLETLRLSRGLTQVELAQATQISQATLSKVESGAAPIDDERWQVLADVLQVPVSAFMSAAEEFGSVRVFHRKQKSTPKGAIKRIGADVALTQRRVGSILDTTRTTLTHHDLDGGFVTPQEVALELRVELGLGMAPIADLIDVVERTGATVVRWPLDSIQVDAIAAWPENAAPVILVGEHVGAERLRFTIAHELGHAVMHRVEADDAQEKEADAFAGEFLLPGAELRKEWPADPTVESLTPIKRKWGISLSALIRRAFDISILTERDYRQWNIRLASSGMHRNEPHPLPAERPQALSNVIKQRLEEGATVEELADRAHMHASEFTATFLE
ncbi:ImmA/IrrE family metallo-endopeptidase [Schumannella luteola]|uniref:Zn-dependent peptidase ImmA (M78 family)/transcriptional regulator with XRE-family HTH domain n=1 Tax=Schumannella luteola TaxID=472059 RepID=A0A852YE82_9MICO|nr:Zn-dependent peptidase ImmA (M78 family)/transcriptional regulator with XRE-family HTH domain [Schumannella luteola]TPX01732.1 ImmA/IrrE family metallo-endopeptidase [Schumannella luteola]